MQLKRSPKYFSSQLSASTGFARAFLCPPNYGENRNEDGEPVSAGYDKMGAPRVSSTGQSLTSHQAIPGLRLLLLHNLPGSTQGRSILFMYGQNLEVELQAAMETERCLQSFCFLLSLLLSQALEKQPGTGPILHPMLLLPKHLPWLPWKGSGGPEALLRSAAPALAFWHLLDLSGDHKTNLCCFSLSLGGSCATRAPSGCPDPPSALPCSLLTCS